MRSRSGTCVTLNLVSSWQAMSEVLLLACQLTGAVSSKSISDVHLLLHSPPPSDLHCYLFAPIWHVRSSLRPSHMVSSLRQGSAQHISGFSIYVELGLCSIDLRCDVSPKICRYISTISYNLHLQTTVTLIYSCRYGKHFFLIHGYYTYELFA